MRTVRDVINQAFGVDDFRKAITNNARAAYAMNALEKVGVRVMRMDGTEFNWRFLKNEPNFVAIVNEALEFVMNSPVKEQ